MNTLDPIMCRQLSMIRKIIADETWLEGERRGCPVSSHDPVVQENVCQVVLRIGREMRRAALAEIYPEPVEGFVLITPLEDESSEERHHEAA